MDITDKIQDRRKRKQNNKKIKNRKEGPRVSEASRK